MAFYITKRIKNIYKTTIEKLRSDIGRICVITSKVTETQTRDCPNCGFDNITNKSNYTYQPDDPYPADISGPYPFRTGSTCPVCKGVGRLLKESESITEVRAKAFIKYLDKMDEEGAEIQSLPAGTLDHTTVRLKFNIKHITAVSASDYIEVDGIKVYTLTTPIKRGLGDVSSFIVYCSESLKSLDSGDRKG